jgi:hypothetical protein
VRYRDGERMRWYRNKCRYMYTYWNTYTYRLQVQTKGCCAYHGEAANELVRRD